MQWAVYGLSRISLFELLEYLGSLSILFAAILYFIDAPERTQMKHDEAWQLINSAQGKGGSGGRIDALQQLNEDGVSLLGVDVSNAFLQGIDLHGADLARADLSSADMRDANLSGARLDSASLRWTNLTGANLRNVDLRDADLQDADLHNADLKALRNWSDIRSVDQASIGNVRNAPPGFLQWARQHGATETDEP